MPKFFVISDVHSFYTPMKEALDAAGFDPDDEDHWLISCGDNFDRGSESVEVLRYLRRLQRKILIKGNHELLLEEYCSRGYPEPHDYHNGTVYTVNQLGHGDFFSERADYAWNRVRSLIKDMRFFYETQHYIFVHSWIPDGAEWRDAGEQEWNQAVWLNPFEQAHRDRGRNIGKTIVHGHWHASAGWAGREGTPEFGEGACFEPFYGEGHIAIDACTVHTHKVNCLVLEDEWLAQSQ